MCVGTKCQGTTVTCDDSKACTCAGSGGATSDAGNTDAGNTDAGTVFSRGAGGCACRAAGGSPDDSGELWLALGLVGLCAVRRRRAA